jgi:hypothetical protein
VIVGEPDRCFGRAREITREADYALMPPVNAGDSTPPGIAFVTHPAKKPGGIALRGRWSLHLLGTSLLKLSGRVPLREA